MQALAIFWQRHRIILAILALALVLRLINLAGRPLWYDEAFTLLYAEKPIAQILHGTAPSAENSTAVEVHPLLYYLGLHAWFGAAGVTPFSVRLPSALMGAATVWLLYLLGSAISDKLGWVTALLAALSPFLIAYSQEARMYSMLGLFGTGAAFTAWRAVHEKSEPNASRKRTGWWTCYTLCGALTLYSHNLGSLFLLALNSLIAVWLVQQKTWTRILPWVVSNLIVLALYAPWLILVIPGQLALVRSSYWIPKPGIIELARSLIMIHFNLPLPQWLLAMALFGALLILVLLFIRTIRLRSRIGASFMWLGLAPLAFMWLVSQWQPVYIERAILPAAGLYLVAVGWLFSGAQLPRVLVAALGLLCLIVAGSSLAYHYTYTGFPRAPFAQADDYLHDAVEPGETIVHSNKLSFFPMYVYDRSLPACWIADPAGDGSDTLALPTQQALGLFPTPDIAAAADDAKGIWFVIFNKAITEYGGNHPQIDWLESNYTLAGIEHFQGLQIRHYIAK